MRKSSRTRRKSWPRSETKRRHAARVSQCKRRMWRGVRTHRNHGAPNNPRGGTHAGGGGANPG
eukprot:13347598-Alexandrium_andersonii.AAC.1